MSEAAQQLAAELMARQREARHAKHTRPWQPSMTPATSLGYACIRRIVYQRCWSLMAKTIDPELASIFEEGNLHQTNVRMELAQLGYEVVEQEVNFKDRDLEITGTIDGRLLLPAEPGERPRRVPVEIKSTVGGGPTNATQWRDSDNKLLRRYFAQLQTYLVLTNEPDGLGLFKDKITGLWSVCAVDLDYDYAEGLLQRAEVVRDYVSRIEAGTDEPTRVAQLPDRIEDRSECDGCPWKDTICHPEEAPVDSLLLANDVDLISMLEERERLDEPRRRYAKIDKHIKQRFELTAGDRFVAGEYMITKKKTAKTKRIDIERMTKSEDKTDE